MGWKTVTRTTIFNIRVVIAVVFIAVVVMPYIIITSSEPLPPEQWKNYSEHVYVNRVLVDYPMSPVEPYPFFGMLKFVAVVVALSIVGTLICIAMRGPYEPERDEMFDRWDGRQ
jgi:hypothetical protein